MFDLGRTGIWAIGLRYGDPGQIAEAATELEELGYNALWIPDAGGDLFTSLEILLKATRTITVASGVLNIWKHTAEETAAFAYQANSTFKSRLLIGIGVSHALRINKTEPGRYRRPMAAMSQFLDELDEANPPLEVIQRVLGALGPKMLEMARERSSGAHTYNGTAEHTAMARQLLGSDRLVVPELAVALTSDPEVGRKLGRTHLARYLELTNYTNNLLRLGFSAEDLRDGGSNRLVDALVAWGDVDAIVEAVRAHRDAGADHVCVQVLSEDVSFPQDAWRELAPALVGT